MNRVGKQACSRRIAAPQGRAATIAILAERLTRETGRVPTDAELARLLATSPTHVQRHRERQKGGAR
jgi:hypothetical protein